MSIVTCENLQNLVLVRGHVLYSRDYEVFKYTRASSFSGETAIRVRCDFSDKPSGSLSIPNLSLHSRRVASLA